jgi:hypothetical protein
MMDEYGSDEEYGELSPITSSELSPPLSNDVLESVQETTREQFENPRSEHVLTSGPLSDTYDSNLPCDEGKPFYH